MGMRKPSKAMMLLAAMAVDGHDLRTMLQQPVGRKANPSTNKRAKIKASRRQRRAQRK